MAMIDLPPALLLMAGAVAMTLARGKVRWVIGLGAPIVALADSWYVITEGAQSYVPFLGHTLNPVHVHHATPVFATIFCIAALGGMLFSLHQDRRVEQSASLWHAGGALGVVFAGDLVTLLVFWELMTLGSLIVIWSGGQKHSYGAGLRYFGMHALGGVALMIGIIMVVTQRISTGHADPLAFSHFAEFASAWPGLSWDTAGVWLILVGMLVNVGAPPFSPWIADAYPEGSFSGTVVLSAFTTKTAVFTLLVGFAGLEALIYLGLWMACYGIVYAILENDMRRILAYSIVNQVGFMMVGIGIGTKLSIDGTAAHAFAHIVYKGLLMMSAGSVLAATGKRKCTELGGLYRTMPITMWCGIIGALSISSFPLTSGFTTKSMIVDSIYQQSDLLAQAGVAHTHLIVAWFMLEAATAGVFLHAGIKFPWFVFFQKDSGLRPPDPPWNMRAAMVGFAAICVFLGIFPGILYDILPYKLEAGEYARVVYKFEHVMKMLGLLLFGGLAFFVLLPILKRKETITLDWDWLWRAFIPRLYREVLTPLLEMAQKAQKVVLETLPGKSMEDSRLPAPIARKLGSAWAVSVPVLLIVLMLLVYLVIYFVVPSI